MFLNSLRFHLTLNNLSKEKQLSHLSNVNFCFVLFFFVILHVVNCNARCSLDVAFRHGLSAIWKRSRQMAIGQGQKMSSFEIIRAKLVSLAVTETRKFLFVESRLTEPNSVRLFFFCLRTEWWHLINRACYARYQKAIIKKWKRWFRIQIHV